METWLAGTALPDLWGIEAAQCNDGRLARTLDALSPHVAAIWQDVLVPAVHTFALDLSRMLYDRMSVASRGAYDAADLIRFGYSRDYRPDRKQLELATTVTLAGGVPLDYRVCAGNVADVTTPVDNLHRLQTLLALLPVRVGSGSGSDPAGPPPALSRCLPLFVNSPLEGQHKRPAGDKPGDQLFRERCVVIPNPVQLKTCVGAHNNHLSADPALVNTTLASCLIAQPRNRRLQGTDRGVAIPVAAPRRARLPGTLEVAKVVLGIRSRFSLCLPYPINRHHSLLPFLLHSRRQPDHLLPHTPPFGFQR